MRRHQFIFKWSKGENIARQLYSSSFADFTPDTLTRIICITKFLIKRINLIPAHWWKEKNVYYNQIVKRWVYVKKGTIDTQWKALNRYSCCAKFLLLTFTIFSSATIFLLIFQHPPTCSRRTIRKNCVSGQEAECFISEKEANVVINATPNNPRAVT